MNDEFTTRMVRFAERLADESRAILREVAGEIPEVNLKADQSYVTETDRRVETRLREIIDAEYPEHGILGEEHGSRNLDAEYVWVLDPIDGTAPFVAGIPVYGTLIGLAHAGQPWLGVIDHPATADRWIGVSGAWATFNGAPVRTRSCPDFEPALMTNSNPDFFSPSERAAFDALRTRVSYTQYGGSCYAYGILASGRTDLAVDGGLDPFDIFAPAAVIEGAGGVITDWSGRRFTLDWQGLVVAAGDASLHDRALAVLQSAWSDPQ